MGVLVKVFFLCFLLNLVYSKEYIPVLVWDSNAAKSKESSSSALSHLSTEEFADYFVKRVGNHKPLIAVFTEENLSVEDFSWRDVDDNGAFPYLSKITKLSKGVEFFPSVHAPYKALRKLQEHGYSWELYNKNIEDILPDEEAIVLLVKLDDPVTMEDRPDMLRNHDKQIATIYSKLLSLKTHVIGVYTGHHSSYSEIDTDTRVRRQAPNGTQAAEPPTDSGPFSFGSLNTLFYFRKPIKVVKGGQTIEVTNATVVTPPTDDKKADSMTVTLRYLTGSGAESATMTLKFSGAENLPWSLTGIAFDSKSDANVMKPNMNIWAPTSQSYSCGQTVKFGTGNDYVVFDNFQLQAFWTDKGKFGPYTDCTMFFTAPIWSGIFVVFILFLITTWGITMIMDINTMDRFDDPKGKTITIAAAE